MTVAEMIDALSLEVIHMPNGATDREISGGYTGDLLSWVMGCVKENEVWVTIMTNINVVAVALLRDVAAVILAENAEIDESVTAKAQEEGVTLLRAPLSSFALCTKIGNLLGEDGTAVQ